MLDKKVIQFTRDGIKEQNLATGETTQLTQSEHGKQIKYNNGQFVYHSAGREKVTSRSSPHVITHAKAHRFGETVVDTSFSPQKPSSSKLKSAQAALRKKQTAGQKSAGTSAHLENKFNHDTSLPQSGPAQSGSSASSPPEAGGNQYAVQRKALQRLTVEKKRKSCPPANGLQYESASKATQSADTKLRTAANAKALKKRLLAGGIQIDSKMMTGHIPVNDEENTAQDELSLSGKAKSGKSLQQLMQSSGPVAKKLRDKIRLLAALKGAKTFGFAAAPTAAAVYGSSAAQAAGKSDKTFSVPKSSSKKIGICIIAVLLIFLILFFTSFGGIITGFLESSTSSAALPAAVENYRPVVSAYAAQFGMTDYVDLILAVMAQESGGAGLDPMQASEGPFNTKYLPKGPNAITDPQYSIWCGIQELKQNLQLAGCTSPYDMEHIKLALQGYNYGSGYITWAKSHGGYSVANALQFSNMMAKEEGWSSYGDPQYAEHVLRYYSGIGGGAGYGDASFQNIKKVGESLIGTPYVLGGNTPHKAMDCSSFVCYVFTKAGKNMPHTTAQGIYNQYCTPIPPSEAKAGDLIFFTNTYNCGDTITHVGIYCGNGIMLEEGGSHAQYANCNSSYWKTHFYAYGRVK